MKLEDIYFQLAYGELRNIALGNGLLGAVTEGEGIPAANYAKLLPFVQLGLTELHKRFPLKENTITVTLQPSQVIYPLTIAYAVSNTATTGTKHITDTTLAPFRDDLMQIERVYGTYEGKSYEIPLNEIDNPESIRTTAYNVLLLPDDTETAPWLLETTTLRVVYRADHPAINKYMANAAPGVTEIFLPPSHLEPLLYYIASRQHNPIGISNEFHEGNNYFAKFEASCALLESTGLTARGNDGNSKLDRRGFV